MNSDDEAPSPAVSIVIAVRDGAAHVEGLRAMVDAQVLRDLEVVVVDDASSDETPRLVQVWAEESDLAVRVVRLPQQSGASAARRAGVRAARGRWVWFADADDRFDPDLLSEAVQVAEQHEADLLCFRARPEHEDGSRHPVVLYGQPMPTVVQVLDVQGAVDAVFSGRVMGYLWDKVFSRDLVSRAYDSTPDLRTHEDLLLLLTVLTMRPRMVLVPGEPYAYVVRPTSLSNVRRPSYPDLERCAEQADRVAAELGPGSHFGTFQARYVGLSAIEDAVRKGSARDVRAAARSCGLRLRAASPLAIARDHGWAVAGRTVVARWLPSAYGRLYGTVRGAVRITQAARR